MPDNPNDGPIPSGSQSPAEWASPPAPPVKEPSTLVTIFIGPNGIRAGWRLLMFLAFMGGTAFTMQFILTHIPYVVRQFPPDTGGPTVVTPGVAIFGEGLMLVWLLVGVLIMRLIEKRTLADYGLPSSKFFGKSFWVGVPYGFAMLSLLLAGIAALHGFSLGTVDLTSAAAIHYGILYGIAFIMVGYFEEFWFRGYMQATLGSGIGFWPAAILLSLAFGAIHLNNFGEGKFGAAMAGAFGLVAAFSLARTGTIWFAIGMHAGWDWAETYFYGTPDSGLLAKGHLLNATFHGANWITGGTVGPEGSYLVPVVLALGAVGIHFLFPARREAA
jgi:membrane protease YdiL (CAAX protease family)